MSQKNTVGNGDLIEEELNTSGCTEQLKIHTEDIIRRGQKDIGIKLLPTFGRRNGERSRRSGWRGGYGKLPWNSRRCRDKARGSPLDPIEARDQLGAGVPCWKLFSRVAGRRVVCTVGAIRRRRQPRRTLCGRGVPGLRGSGAAGLPFHPHCGRRPSHLSRCRMRGAWTRRAIGGSCHACEVLDSGKLQVQLSYTSRKESYQRGQRGREETACGPQSEEEGRRKNSPWEDRAESRRTKEKELSRKEEGRGHLTGLREQPGGSRRCWEVVLQLA